jgi:hypothetical protein
MHAWFRYLSRPLPCCIPNTLWALVQTAWVMIWPLRSSSSVLPAAFSQARNLRALAALILRTRPCTLATSTRLSVAFSLWTLHTQNVPRMTRGQLRRAYTLTAHWQFPPTPRLSHLSFRFQAYIGFCSTETNILSAGAMAPSADPLFLRPESWVTQALRWRRKSALRPSRSWQDGRIYSRSNVAPARPL